MRKLQLIIVLLLFGFISCDKQDSKLIKPKLIFDTNFPIKNSFETHVEELSRGNIKISYCVLNNFELNEKEENLFETVGKHSKQKQKKYHSFFIFIDENENDTLDVSQLLNSLKNIDIFNRKTPHLYSYAFTENKYKGFIKESLKLDSVEQSFYYLAELSLYTINKRIRISTNVVDDFSHLHKINESRFLLNSLDIVIKSDSLEVLPKNQPSNPGW